MRQKKHPILEQFSFGYKKAFFHPKIKHIL
jgi:hypothetical protein